MASSTASSFIGVRLPDLHSTSGRVTARFGFGKKAPAAPKKATKTVTSDRPLWYPGAKAPEYLDGSLVGDYGFDPFGLGKPAEYLQFDLDSLDQNLAKNVAGDVIGTRFESADVKSTPFQPYSEVFGLQRFRECELIHGRWAMLATLGALTVESVTGVTWQDAGKFDLDSLDQNLAKNVAGDVIGTRFESADVKSTPFQPYSEVFGLQRFRECELIHGRWAMLATLGALTVESVTGVTWQDAGKVELIDGSSYLGQPLPFSITTLIWIEVLVIGYIEFQRNAELEPEKRLYPGGPFDPLNLASDPEKKATLQLAEIKHARLAMVAFLGFAVQAAATGKGPLNNWVTHLSDPLHTTILDTFGFFS
ncbi:putative chlorophyll A-B binding protein [Helianthus anomalus]